MALPASKNYTSEEYLEFERKAEYKNEYIDGHIVAMSGGSSAHNLIALNIGGELRQQLKDTPCLVYPSDMRVKVRESRFYTYPDVAVVCAEPEFEDERRDTLLNPAVLVEVLSPSTANYDRGAKFTYYRQLPSLREYLLVAQDEQRVQQFVLTATGWMFNEAYQQGDVISLPSIGCELPLSEVYRKVALQAAQEPDL